MTICNPWRPGACLVVLRGQLDAAAPNRSKASDGFIGDTAHQAEACSSEHNSCCIRYLGVWIIRAGDYTHDPARGADMFAWSEALRRSRDPRIRYVIFNRRITGPNHTNAQGEWIWDPYTGDSPHEEHMHVSTTDSPAQFDDTRLWATPHYSAAGTNEEDLDMGDSMGPLEILRGEPSSYTIPPTMDGAMDPRPQWIHFNNDTGGLPGQKVAPPYGLRIVVGNGHGGYRGVGPGGSFLVKFESGVAQAFALLEGEDLVSLQRCAMDKNNNPIDPASSAPLPDGARPDDGRHRTFVIERGAINQGAH